MNRIVLLSFGLLGLFSSATRAQSLSVAGLSSEYAVNPIGLSPAAPVRLSWRLVSTERNVLQTAYEIKVFSGRGRLVWNSSKTVSGQSVHIRYKGPALLPRSRYYWQVRVWDNHGHGSEWSPLNYWETGLNSGDWSAKWITPEGPDSAEGPVPMLRKGFAVSGKIRQARLYITAHGLYEAWINGRRVGDGLLTPGWTNYRQRLQYQVYDVTSLLATGANAAAAIIGDGWYRGPTYRGRKNIYGNTTGLLFQLEITLEDGSRQTVVSDGSWRSSDGPIRYSEFFNGEVYDARMEKAGWQKAGYDDAAWAVVRTERPDTTARLIATDAPLVRRHEVFKPLSILRTPKGETVIDFGQNLVGWVRWRSRGRAGDTIVVRHGEVLDPQGNFYTANLRSARQTITYISKGGAEEWFEPHFTFQGFRYVKVEGPVDLQDIEAVAIYSDMEQTGDFTTSDTLINRLQHNIQWGQRGNFIDIPTDCPQRDERLGWTGDAQAFSATATFNMDVAMFYAKWLADLRSEQLPDGAVPYVIPNVLRPQDNASAGWSDVATIAPWNVYLAYGDTTILRDQYTSMKAWVDYIRAHAVDDLWNTGDHFGDWLFYTPGDADDDGRAAITDKHLIAQTFYAHSTQLLINAAKVLGRQADVSAYSALLKRIKDVFVDEYTTRRGRLVSGSQTAYVLALRFDMLPDSLRPQAAARLVQNIKDYGNHLTTGFLGTPHLCHVLTRYGYNDVAYRLLMQRTYPSWLYPVTRGATTIWERWDGIRPDGSLQQANMNSFNHYAYGAIGDWMYKTITGVNPVDSAPGYKKILFRPRPGGGLTHAAAHLRTLYGMVSLQWTLDSGRIAIDVTIPPNTTAELDLPGKKERLELGSGDYHYEYVAGAGM
ncbi:MAG: family 78 glycoside hydrolase catalytic domain [Bacteroidetes bacterium]|nr:family 78 glycoside hydrolase catalytic domain [Bacteroidota bacterium]